MSRRTEAFLHHDPIVRKYRVDYFHENGIKSKFTNLNYFQFAEDNLAKNSLSVT